MINIIQRKRDKFIFRELYLQNFEIENCFKSKMTMKTIGSSAAGRQKVPTRYFLF